MIDAIFDMVLQTAYYSIIIHLSVDLQKTAKLSLIQSLIQSYRQPIYRRTAINVPFSWLIEAAQVSLMQSIKFIFKFAYRKLQRRPFVSISRCL